MTILTLTVKPQERFSFDKTIITIIEFFQQANKCKSKIVYSSALSIYDLINEAAASKIKSTASNSGNYESADYQQIRSVAGRIREEIRKSSGIKLRPLDDKEIYLETAKRIVPPHSVHADS